jgi:hypothetical protein
MAFRKTLGMTLYLLGGMGLSFAALMTVAVGGGVTDKEGLKRALSSEELFAILKSEELEKEVPGRLELDEVILDGKASVETIQAIIPEEDLRRHVASLVDAAYDKPEGLSGFDLRPFKLTLSAFYDSFAEAYARVAPVGAPRGPAAPHSFDSLGEASASTDAAPTPVDLSARPSDLGEAEFAAFVRASLDMGIRKLPDSLGKVDYSVPRLGATATGITLATVGAALVALLAITLIRSGGWKERIRWFGASLIPPAAATLLLGILFLAVKDASLMAAFGSIGNGSVAGILSHGTGKALFEYVSKLVAIPALRMVVTGSVVIAAGAVAIVSSRSMPETDEA